MQRGSVKVLVVLLLVVLVAAVSYLVVKSGGGPKSLSQAVGGGETKVRLSDTLISRVPENAVAFAYWEGKHPAYLKLEQSPWGQSGSMADLRAASKEFAQVAGALAKAGLDLENKEIVTDMLAEVVFFVLPVEAEAGDQEAPPIGWIFKPRGKDLAKLISEAKKELPKAGVKVQDFRAAGGEGLQITSEPGGSGSEPDAKEGKTDLFLLALGELGIGGLSKSVVERTAAYPGGALPAIAQTDLFRRTVAGLPGDDERFGLVYLDGEAMERAITQAKVQAVELQNLPFRSLALGFSMLEAPQVDARFIHKSKVAEAEKFASVSSVVFDAAPSSPLLLLTFDGDLLGGLTKTAGLSEPMAADLAFLSDVKRVGISASVAAPGQSMLPLPDLLLLFETENTKALQQGLEKAADNMISSSLGAQGGPAALGMQWTEQELPGGKKIKGMMTPMGVGVFLASFDNLVVAASTEQQIRALAGSTSKSGGLSPTAAAVFREAVTAGNLYLSFANLASFLENLSGMLALFAPQQAGQAAPFLSPEKLANLRNMGSLVAYASLRDDTTDLKLFYEKPSK
jgi:hypothetical protein